MRIALIVAIDRNGLIGCETGLPWHLPADLRRFRKLTTGHPIIMGRKTHEHIGGPLKDRTNIVLTRRTDFQSVLPDCVVAHSFDEALRIAEQAPGADEVFVIGGAEVYRQAMSIVNRVYLTIVEGEFDGDTWFPFDDMFRGSINQDETLPKDAKNPHSNRFVIVDRATDGVLIRDLLDDDESAV